jgi:hypothetical protein
MSGLRSPPEPKVGKVTAQGTSGADIRAAPAVKRGRGVRALMRLRRWCILFSLAGLLGPASIEAQQRSQTETRPSPNFWHAAAGVALTNWVTWAYNWYVQRWPWASVGFQSWGQNLRKGFVWDNDCFLDDQFAHPYHGSFYYNSARASGFGYWGSIPFAAVGSATWELFGENIPAALNDLINTTLGGVAIGEVTYRLSTLLGSGGGGKSGLGRELGAFALNPMGRAQGLLQGAAEQLPGLATMQSHEPARIAVGHRSGRKFFEFAVRYQTPFHAGVVRPYDAFEFRMELSPESSDIVHHISISGLLTRKSLSRTARDQLVFGVYQHYDYDGLSGVKTSGNSVSAALLYRRGLGARTELNLNAHAEGVLLGGITSEHGNYWRRDYDLGPGAGIRLGAGLVREGREWLRVDGRLLWLHSLHGSRGDHLATFIRAGASLPLIGPLGVGGDVALTTRHSRFPDFPAVTRRVPQVRAYVTWLPF